LIGTLVAHRDVFRQKVVTACL